MAPFHHLPILLLLLLLPFGALLPTAAATPSSHHTSPPHLRAYLHHLLHHHRSPMTTATTSRIIPAPSMHQNRLESEESQSLLVVDPVVPITAQAPSGEEAMAAMAAAADPSTRLDPPQAPSPPPSIDAAADLASSPPLQLQQEVEWSASGVAAPPPLDEPAATTTTTPLPLSDPYDAAASPPVPVDASAEETSDNDLLGPQQLAKVLTSLGYNEMASAAPLLADSPTVAGWPGALTVFAAPDVLLQASCPGCSRRRLLLEHIALGYFPFSELAAMPTVKLPTASIGFCLNVAADTGPFAIHHVNLYVDGVEISHPELYNDGRYVVHGLRSFIPPLSHTSCSESEADEHNHHHHRRHHLTARSAATSAATAASIVRIMIRDAISRLRDGGFGFVSLAMRVKFAELEKMSNMTVFALDDQAIFSGGGHDYVSSVRFHIVPEHRLTRADLLQLRPGIKLPTLAGEDHKLVITRGGAGSGSDEVRINYIPVKEPDVVVNSRVAVHGIYVPFPRLHLANLASSVAAVSTNDMKGTCGVEEPYGGCASTAMTSSATISATRFYGDRQ
ncbi:hypothetical protein QOZ80_2BG0184460 [Eleusine coracana subsp. coracana]|nr:hypothetical protein QOZ80_2BG0184460 [Eleusine coracana subsp. coracana]